MSLALLAPEEAYLKAWLGEVADEVAVLLDAVLPPVNTLGEVAGGAAQPLYQAMRYATLGGGKRVRAGLVVAAYELAGGHERARALRVAAAVEMMHAYSLIQDDMPCMDNDTLRRGKPTTHVQFGEAVALLASDGLQTGALEVLADATTHPSAEVRLRLVQQLSHAAGARGMVAGQTLDMAVEGGAQLALVDLEALHSLKTGAMIQASILCGICVAENDNLKENIAKYAINLGKAFQIWDDVLDVTADAALLGKTAGKDVATGKVTFVSLLGLDGAKHAAREQAQAALAALEPYGDDAEVLRLLARWVVTRGH